MQRAGAVLLRGAPPGVPWGVFSVVRSGALTGALTGVLPAALIGALACGLLGGPGKAVAAMAAGLAVQTDARAAPAPADPAGNAGWRAPPDTLAQRLVPCSTCHGAQGQALASGYAPRIAGKPADYLYNQLRAFRDGRRPHATMAELLAPLGDAYLAEIARHFASLHRAEPPAAAPKAPGAAGTRGAADIAGRAGAGGVPPGPGAVARRRAEQLLRHGDPARGLPACSACHGPSLAGQPAANAVGDTVGGTAGATGQPATPGLPGLPRDYLVAQLGAWREGSRHAVAPDCMAQVARRLATTDIAALADLLADLPAEPQPATAAPGAAVARSPWPEGWSCGALPLPDAPPQARPAPPSQAMPPAPARASAPPPAASPTTRAAAPTPGTRRAPAASDAR